MFSRFIAPLVAVLLALSGCGPKFDYKPYRDNLPRSILILPPLNQSNAIEAGDLTLTTLVEPIAEAGYYVYPPLTVQAYLQEQGVPSAVEARDIPLAKLREIFGADAVLYVEVVEWGQQYIGIASTASVELAAKLVDARSGQVLWTGDARASDGSNSNSNSGLVGMIVNATVHAISKTSKEEMLALAHQATRQMVWGETNGLLLGARRSNAAVDRRGLPEQP